MRRKLGIASGTRAELCYAIHAEQNAIIQAAKLGIAIDAATLYCTHQPCSVCAKIIVNAGIKRVVYEQGYPDEFSLVFFHETGVLLERYEGSNA
jgi:dCMP deaminase